MRKRRRLHRPVMLLLLLGRPALCAAARRPDRKSQKRLDATPDQVVDRAFQNAGLGHDLGDIPLIYLNRRRGRPGARLGQTGPPPRGREPTEAKEARDRQARPHRP